MYKAVSLVLSLCGCDDTVALCNCILTDWMAMLAQMSILIANARTCNPVLALIAALLLYTVRGSRASANHKWFL